MSRTRTRATFLADGGKAIRYISGSLAVDDTQVISPNFPASRGVCIDEVNKRSSDNPLDIVFEARHFVPLNGIRDAGSPNERSYKDYIAQGMLISLGHENVLPLIPSVGQVATAALARSNPSKPAISLPNFLYELKDLPGMIRDIGRLKLQLANIRRKGVQQVTPRNAANHLLSYQMGWSPLIGDLRKLLSFQSSVDKKMRELQNLYSGDGIQRRVRSPAWKAVLSSETNSTVESQLGVSISCKRRRTTTVERWATVRWYPTALPDPRFSSDKMARLARDLTFGLHGISPKQVWDAIPWTWLVGWFSNADDFIQAHHNSIPLRHSTPCIMTHRATTYDWSRNPGNEDFIGGYGRAYLDRKERTTSAGTLSASIPFLNGRQISILSALAIQRKR